MSVLGLFKSHYTLGKSILTLAPPSKLDENYPVSIFDIAQEHGLKEVVLVDGSISGFLEAFQSAKKAKVKLIFGLSLNIIDDIDNKSDESKKTKSKVIVFIKNSAGYPDLIKISSKASKDGFYYTPNLDWKNLKALWTPNLKLCIPFYDSFLHKNSLCGGMCIPDFSFTQPDFFIEDNQLPFDGVLKEKVEKYCASYNYKSIPAKSIYYYKKADFLAYLTFRCINNRSLLEKPELEFMSSNKFCYEALEEQNERN